MPLSQESPLPTLYYKLYTRYTGEWWGWSINYHHFKQVNAALDVQFNISDQNLHCKQFFNLKMTQAAPWKELAAQIQQKYI